VTHRSVPPPAATEGFDELPDGSLGPPGLALLIGERVTDASARLIQRSDPGELHELGGPWTLRRSARFAAMGGNFRLAEVLLAAAVAPAADPSRLRHSQRDALLGALNRLAECADAVLPPAPCKSLWTGRIKRPGYTGEASLPPRYMVPAIPPDWSGRALT
jgi:hypothetical protein